MRPILCISPATAVWRARDVWKKSENEVIALWHVFLRSLRKIYCTLVSSPSPRGRPRMVMHRFEKHRQIRRRRPVLHRGIASSSPGSPPGAGEARPSSETPDAPHYSNRGITRERGARSFAFLSDTTYRGLETLPGPGHGLNTVPYALPVVRTSLSLCPCSHHAGRRCAGPNAFLFGFASLRNSVLLQHEISRVDLSAVERDV